MKLLGLALVPILFLVSAAWLTIPDHFYSFGDPDFGYLMNSLLIADGHAVHHIDHPGTPLQWMGAGAIWLVRLVKGTGDNLLALTQYPNAVFFLTAWGSVLALAAAQFGVGLALFRRNISLWTICLIQATPLWFSEFSPRFFRLSPESLMAATSLWVALEFTRAFSQEKRDPTGKDLCRFGVALGAAMTLKANLWPLAILLLTPFFHSSDRKWKQVGVATLATTISFLLITIPAWPRFGALVDWTWRLWSHAGNYGHGPEAITSFQQLGQNLQYYRNNGGFLLHATAVAIAAFVPLYYLARRNWTVIPLFLAFVCTLFLNLKHPGLRYLVAFIPFLALALLALDRLPRFPRATFVLGMLAFSAYSSFTSADRFRGAYLLDAKIHRELKRKMDRKFSNCAIILGTVTPALEFTVFAGNLAATPNLFTARLEDAFPRYSFWLPETWAIRRFGMDLAHEDWLKYANSFPCQVYLGAENAAPMLDRFFQSRFERAGRVDEGVVHYVFYRHEGPLEYRLPLPERRFPSTIPDLPGATPLPPASSLPAR